MENRTGASGKEYQLVRTIESVALCAKPGDAQGVEETLLLRVSARLTERLRKRSLKAVLVALNAKYIHSNLGVYSLYTYSRKRGIAQEELSYREYTINQNIEDIIGNIYEEKPDLLGFSCYIWNIEMIDKIARELRKLLPECMIWYGGPEVGFHGEQVLCENAWVDGVFCGEGEISFYEVLECYRSQGRCGDYTQIQGLVVRSGREIITTAVRRNCSLDEIAFPYADMSKLQSRIVYYETSRGCPYGCSYCLSSIEKRVRFRSMELVQKELQFFLDQKVPQVKFVDRTFNCNPEHTMAIWKYIHEHDNGVTNFHFELSADLLTEEEIAFVRKFRPGLVQFEIGVQTTNEETLQAICRKTDLAKLQKNVAKIWEGRNIHQHLDLIIGLPYEDMTSFRKSFNDVYDMNPDQLQVGFLKVLKGSPLERQAEAFGIVSQSVPPYEVLYTKWISYEEVRELKLVEEMVERYYNSMQFQATIPYMVKQFPDAFTFYDTLGKWFRQKGYLEVSQSRIQNYELLYKFAGEWQMDGEVVRELLIFDLYAREKLKKEPDFLEERKCSKEQRDWECAFYQKEENRQNYLPGYEGYSWKQVLRMTHIEWFSYDIPLWLKERNLCRQKTKLLFDYAKRNPLDHQAEFAVLEDV